MMLTIKCPKCGTDGKMSLVDPNYTGPYKCWSCRQFFTLQIQDDAVVSMEPLSDADYHEKYTKKNDTLDAMRANFRIGGRPNR